MESKQILDNKFQLMKWTLDVSIKTENDPYEPNYNNADYALSERINKLASYYNLPLDIKLILLSVKDENDYVSINLEDRPSFSFFSIKELERMHDDYVSYGQERWIDLCTQYHGMGYVSVVSWDKDTCSGFFRMDGGSSDIDRHINRLYFIGNDERDAVFNVSDFTNYLKPIDEIMTMIRDDTVVHNLIVCK